MRLYCKRYLKLFNSFYVLGSAYIYISASRSKHKRTEDPSVKSSKQIKVVLIILFQVYTINDESKYLLVQGVPSVNAKKELLQLFEAYGEIEEYDLDLVF